MMIEEITEGLLTLLKRYNYNPETIRFYEREWNKIREFLLTEYGDAVFDMERGLKYLENKYGIVTRYNDGTLSQQRVQLLRVVHLLEDYRLHGVLTRRCYASKNPIVLDRYCSEIYAGYKNTLGSSELAASTVNHYSRTAVVFLDYLSQLGIRSISLLSAEHCHSYVKTLSGYGFKTIEQAVCGLRHFMRFLYDSGQVPDDLAGKIHMPAVSKNAKIPSAWDMDDLKAMLSVIDRTSPIGKRDYAMVLLACVLGLRISDIKALTFSCFDWEGKKLSFIQHKTKKPLALPLPDAVGWAVIDYIRHGRPDYRDTDVIFLKHMPPFDPIADNNHMQQMLARYMRKAGIDRRGRKHSGFHSLRHSTGSMLLEMETPLPVITEILGHSGPDMTAVYLKTDLKKLSDCVLPLEGCL